MVEKTIAYMHKHMMTHPGDCILIALSGGSDSIALLQVLNQAQSQLGIHLVCAHLDHGIRPESYEDAQFVRKICEQLEIPLFCHRVDIPALAGQWGVSLEMAARKSRWSFLRDIAQKVGCTAIATAHHEDDQAETVLLRLTRGTGPDGLAAMQPVSGDIIRPFLWTDKEQILDYLQENHFEWREDSSNRDIHIPRNLIRHEILNRLSIINDSAISNIARTASLAAQDADYFRHEVDRLMGTVIASEQGLHLSMDVIKDCHPAILTRLLRAMASEMGLREQIETVHIENAVSLLNSRTGASIHWPERMLLVKESDGLTLLRDEVPPLMDVIPLNLQGETLLPGSGRLYSRTTNTINYADDYIQCFRLSALEGAVIRSRRTGDVFRPLGMIGEKKLKKQFIDLKIGRFYRDSLPLLAVGKRILWIIGYSVSEDGAIHADQLEPMVEITYTKLTKED